MAELAAAHNAQTDRAVYERGNTISVDKLPGYPPPWSSSTQHQTSKLLGRVILETENPNKIVCISRGLWSKWHSILKLYIYGFLLGNKGASGAFIWMSASFGAFLFAEEADFDFHHVRAAARRQV